MPYLSILIYKLLSPFLNGPRLFGRVTLVHPRLFGRVTLVRPRLFGQVTLVHSRLFGLRHLLLYNMSTCAKYGLT
jgi:hypothetical protein